MINNLNICLDKPEITTTALDEVKQIIMANLRLGGDYFPFNPQRGIDLDEFLFDYQDEATTAAQTTFLKQRIQTLDKRISSVEVAVQVIEKHINQVDILIDVNGQYDKITIDR